MLKRVPKYLRNRYTITSIVFVVWLLFFENIDMISLFRYRSELGNLQEEKAAQVLNIEAAREQYDELTSDPEKLEKFAREQHLMKKEGEILYVLVPEKEEE